MGQALLFYFFSAILIVCSICVVVARNAVHSVLFLILGFLNAAGLFMLLQAELIAMSLVIVYVGAVAVLFMFVVMMLDINTHGLREGINRYGVIGLLVGIIFAVELGLVSWYWQQPIGISQKVHETSSETISNAHALGQVLYTDYVLVFQLAGMILLVAMIGAIVLVLRHREGVHRQDPRKQVLRSPSETLEIKRVESGKGVSL